MPAPISSTGRAAFALRLMAAAACAGPTVLALPAHSAGAGDLADIPIEQLLSMDVYTASKFPQKQSEAPSAVQVITAAEIKAFGWRNLADILRSLRGLYVTNDRNYQHLGARGFLRPGDYNGRFLLMVDGARTNESVYDSAAIGSEFILDIDMIERVEFVPGPGSSIYGANAVFGVINVISKRGRDARGAQAAVVAGSAGEGRARFSYGWRGERDSELLLSATSFSTRGKDLYFAEYDAPETNYGIARHLDYDRGHQFFARGSYQALQFTLAHVTRTKGVPTASFSQDFNDPRSRTKDSQTFFNLQHRLQLQRDTEFTSRLQWQRTGYDGFYFYPFDDLGDGARSRQWTAEFKLVSEAWSGHKLVAGAELQRDYRISQYYTDIRHVQPIRSAFPLPSRLDDSTSANTDPVFWRDERQNRRAGLYVQDEMSLRSDLLLTAGLRFDQSSSAADLASPRAALVWKASQWTTLKALYGSAFRTPNAYELYYYFDSQGGQLPMPNLQSERIRTRELVLEHAFSTSSRLTASLFRNTVDHLISSGTEASGLLQYMNGPRAQARGLEMEFEQAWDNGARLRAGFSRQRVTDDRSGAMVGNSPARLAHVNLSGPLFGGALRTGWETIYVGSRTTLDGAALAGYAISNLNLLTNRLGRGMELSTTLYNLFDKRYADPGSAEHAQAAIIQNGRTLRVKFIMSF